MQSLQDKREASLALLARAADMAGAGRVAVAWTGGKDSTVVLDLWRRVCPGPVLALNLDTGHKFPEIVAFRDRLAQSWGLELYVARPEPGDVPEHIAQDRLACCNALKVLPLRRAVASLGVSVLLTGIRADENPARTGLSHQEERGGYVQLNPILDWTEMDVWAHITGNALPYCELYDRGYRSLGCVPCTRPAQGLEERSGRDAQKEARMDQLRALGYF